MPRRLHQYINYHHPGYIRRLAFAAANFGTRVYQEYRALRSITRDRSTVMPPYSRSRSRGRSNSLPTPSRTGSRGRTRYRARSSSSRMRTGSRSRVRTPRLGATLSRSVSRFRPFPVGTISGYRSGRNLMGRTRSFMSARNRTNAGYLPRSRRVKTDKFFGRNGVVTKQEFGSSLSDPDCVYVGHGIPGNTLIETTLRTLIKMLYHKHGWEIPSFSEVIPLSGSDIHFIQIESYASSVSSSVTLSNTANIVSGDTWETIVNRLMTIFTAISSDKRRWQSIALYDGSNVGTDRTMLAKIMLSKLNMHYYFVSNLKVQNVTEAATGTDANDELTTNVEANPLIGKEYFKKEWKNGFDLYWRPGVTNTDWDGFFVNNTSGVIATTADDATPATGTYNDFKKPPPDFVFNSTRAASVAMDPGQIKTSKIVFKTRLMFQSFMDKTTDIWINYAITSNAIFEFGFAKLIAVEKLLDSRLASDAPVGVQYEVSQTLKVRGNELPSSTMPHVSIL